LEEKNPWEQPALRELILRAGARDARKGQSPEAAALRLSISRFGERFEPQANGMWVRRKRKRSATLQVEKAPKGESHERRRHETKPAGQ
jgi:hypothetical protein